jgi:hypothetical protein
VAGHPALTAGTPPGHPRWSSSLCGP